MSTDRARLLPTGVKSVVKRQGTPREARYYYHRETGKRLPGEPWSPAFMSALAAEEGAPARPKAAIEAPREERFTDLLDAFLESPEHRNTAPSTRRKRESEITRLRARFYYLLVRDLKLRAVRRDFYELRDDMRATPTAADAMIDTLTRILNWAVDRGIIEWNPAARLGNLLSPHASRAHIVWTSDLEARFVAGAPEHWRQLFQFALYTAARASDCAAMRWEQFDGRWLSYKPQKTARSTGVIVHLPVYALPPLRELIAELSRATEYMLTANGPTAIHPWRGHSISTMFADIRRSILGPDCRHHFHDLRGTTVTRLLAAGSSDAETASISGHAIGRGSELGTYADRTRQLAVNAYEKWARAIASDAKVLLLPRSLP